MKTTLKKAAAIGLTALVVGNAAAQESVSKPVGYETIQINQQFNYVGLRLVGTAVATGAVTGATDPGVEPAQFSVDGATPADGTYIVEINDGDGVGAVVEGTVSGGVVTVDVDVLENLANGDSVTLREPQTLAGVFGNPVVGLSGASSSGAADLILLPDGTGGFKTYWYSVGGFGGAGAGWKELNTANNSSTDVDASSIFLFYTDGIVIENRGANNTIVVSGSVKTTQTNVTLTTQFNYLSSIYPVGGTLSSAFDNPASPGTLAAGSLTSASSSGAADLVYIPNASGAFDIYWYSVGGFGGAGAGWKQLNPSTNISTDVVSTSVSFDSASGYIVENRGSLPQGLPFTAPSFYSSL